MKPPDRRLHAPTTHIVDYSNLSSLNAVGGAMHGGRFDIAHGGMWRC